MVPHWCDSCRSCWIKRLRFHRILADIAIAEQRMAARNARVFHRILFGV